MNSSLRLYYVIQTHTRPHWGAACDNVHARCAPSSLDHHSDVEAVDCNRRWCRIIDTFNFIIHFHAFDRTFIEEHTVNHKANNNNRHYSYITPTPFPHISQSFFHICSIKILDYYTKIRHLTEIVTISRGKIGHLSKNGHPNKTYSPVAQQFTILARYSSYNVANKTIKQLWTEKSPLKKFVVANVNCGYASELSQPQSSPFSS